MTTLRTPALCSELELNPHLLVAGDVVYYSDAANFQRWEVTELFDGGFEAKDGYETKDFYFNGLQIGWQLSARTKHRAVECRATYTSREEWAQTGQLNG